MKNILITGATGNVGLSVIKALQAQNFPFNITAGVRNLAKDAPLLANYKVTPIQFDFENANTYAPALEHRDVLFLLRPPSISDVAKYFQPLIGAAKRAGVGHIVFLSVQGVEKSTIIPHHKIEELIIASKIPFTFLRPAYFMQNFTTTLKHDLVTKHLIYLPAGNAKFTLVDVGDIGAVAAQVLIATEMHANQKYELTSHEKLTFGQMADCLTKGLGVKITYKSPNLLQFFLAKKREHMPTMLVLVMIMLHYLPRFQQEPLATDWVFKITDKQPVGFEDFVKGNRLLMV